MSALPPFAYVADWTRRRSSARLRADLAATLRRECECDGYTGFECGKHRRAEELTWALARRGSPTNSLDEEGCREDLGIGQREVGHGR